jgi:hypothetical protein
MLTTISRLVRPPMAILALWATIYMFTTSAALATQSPCAAKNQRWMERSSLYVSTLQDFTPMTRDGCQFIRAELLDTNGPTGGWCWRITTACDQYLQGDCWYTSEASAVHAPTLKSVASTR